MSEFESLKQGVRHMRQDAEVVLREHLDLRLAFAERVQSVLGISFREAVETYTDLYRRLRGEWMPAVGAEDPQWNALMDEMEQISEHDRRLEKLSRFAESHPIKSTEHQSDRFWPFRYDYVPSEHLIDLHFGSLDYISGPESSAGLLSKERMAEQRDKLKEMFMAIKKMHPDARYVGARTYLFSWESWNRLFPPSFRPVPGIKPDPQGFTGAGRWGQFYDAAGKVRQDQKDVFLNNIRHLDAGAIAAAFPNHTYRIRAPIGDFYREYGIE
jgi:hypothetical protein